MYKHWLEKEIRPNASSQVTVPRLQDDAVYESIRKAQAIVAEATPPADDWRWNEVRDVVSRIGLSLQVTVMENPPEGSRMAYAFNLDTMDINQRAVMSLSPDRLAQVLVHEATHAVYIAEVLKRIGLTRMEFARILDRCQDYTRGFYIATEALAHRNEAVWWRLQGAKALNDSSAKQEFLETALAALTNEPSATRKYLLLMWQYADFTMRINDSAKGASHCPALVVLEGEYAGHAFYPSDIDPWLVPLFVAPRPK